MSFLGGPPDQAKKPLADVLPDGRKRLTRYFQLTATGGVPPRLDLAPGTADEWTDAPTGWTGLLLTYKKLEDDLAPKGNDTRPILTLIFEQIAATGETQVGDPDITFDQYNNKIVTLRWVQFSSTTATSQTVGTTAAPSPNATAILKEEVATDDGTLRQITRVYTTGGIMSDVQELRFGGKVVTRTIVSLNQIPSTPAGFTLVGPGVVYVRGLPLYTYQYAAAAGAGGVPGTGGVISYEYYNAQGAAVDFNPAAPNTADGATRATIRYVSTPSITANPITTPTGFVLVGIERSEETGYVLWTGTYYRGDGLVQQDISTRQDGLREVTNLSLGTRVPPSGIVIQDDYKNGDGFTVYTVTAMQAADGGADPSLVDLEFERFVPFLYPGRAKAWVETVGSQDFLDAFLSPPVETLVQATVIISYTTTDTLGTISDFWNPTEWATMKATWVGAYGVAASRNRPLDGYRSVTATPVTLTSTGYNQAIFGYNIYNGEDGTITITGGPSNPGGTTKTLSADLAPAFTSTAGVQWYRKTLVVAAIPNQAALPV